MKTLFSLKARIGAILTAAALLATALPMTGFAATKKEAPELLKNGSFSALTDRSADPIVVKDDNSDKTYTYGAEFPDGWELGLNSLDTGLGLQDPHFGVMTSANLACIRGSGIYLNQYVDNIEAGKSYTLRYGTDTPGNAYAMVHFYNKDADGNYVDLATYAAAGNTSILSFPLGSDSNYQQYTRVYKVTRGGSRNDANVHNIMYELNFIAPPGTNAVRVRLFSECPGSQWTYFDNVSLKENTQVVNNGRFDDTANDPIYASSWQGQARVENGNSYRAITTPGTEAPGQYIIWKADTRYRITYKYRTTFDEDFTNTAPNIYFNAAATPHLWTSGAKKIGTAGDWDIYEQFVQTGSSATGFVSNSITATSPSVASGETWKSGYEVHYDDFSIVEDTPKTLSIVPFTGAASVDYVAGYNGETADVIVAKYEPGTTNLVGIERETIGADALAGIATTYLIDMDADYDVKVFLWDGIGTMKPIATHVERDSIGIASLPYYNDFEDPAKVLGFNYAYHSVSNGAGCGRCGGLHGDRSGANGNIALKNGKLCFENSDWDGVICFWYNYNEPDPFHDVQLSFEPEDKGIVVFEFDYHITQGADHPVRLGNGFFRVFDSQNNIVAGWYGYHGDGGAYVNGNKNEEKIQQYSWGHAEGDYHFVVEVDLDNKQWKVSGQNVANPDRVYTCTNAVDVARISIGLTQSTDTIDNLKIYKKISAVQDETAFTLNVGETAKAEFSYVPATESMPDMTFASSSAAVAEVSADGVITAKRAGTATITAKSELYNTTLSWNVTVNAPQVTPVALPYDSTDAFTTNGQEVKDLAGWSVVNRAGNAVLAVEDGRLVLSGVDAADRYTGAIGAKLAFEKVEEGKLVIEAEYRNKYGEVESVNAFGGILNVYEENGTKAASVRFDGRGANYGNAWEVDTYRWPALTHDSLQYGATFKFVIDIDEGNYQVYQNGKLLAETDGGKDTFKTAAWDVASFDFTLRNDGDYITGVKVYVEE